MSKNFDNSKDRFVVKPAYLLLPFIIWMLTPYLTFNTPFRAIVLISLFAFLISTFRNGIFNKFSVPIIILIFMIWGVHLLNESQELLRHFHISIYLIISIFSYYIFFKNKNINQYLIIIILVFNLFTILNTSYLLINDMNISRQFVRSDEISKGLALKGIGGYGFIYMNVILFPILILYIKKLFYNKKSKSLSLLVFLNILGIIFLLWKAQYLIALFILFIYLFLYFIKVLFKHPLKSLIFIGLSLFFFLINVMVNFEQYLENTRYLNKYLGILSMISGDSANVAVAGRIEPYLKSFFTILNNPFLGVSKFSFDKIGAHSQVLDIVAQYGLLLGGAIIYYVFKLPLIILKKIDNKYKFEVRLLLVGLILLCSFNTLPFETSISFIFLSLIYNNNYQNV